MKQQSEVDFSRIAKAIGFIGQRYADRPSLDEIAAEVSLSPSHFQRLFTDWAGVSPKKFLQYIDLKHAKQILSLNKKPLAAVADEVGLSGIARLHDLFVTIEGMTPGEYANGGVNLAIDCCYFETLFGRMFAASTSRGICYLAFVDDDGRTAMEELKLKFPKALIRDGETEHHRSLIGFFGNVATGNRVPISLHLKGTPFQVKVWEALLNVPEGGLTTYGELAAQINSPKASRAVGSAVGDNPIAWLIPCHRVILSTGHIGHYHWGKERKTAMIGREAIGRFGGDGH